MKKISHILLSLCIMSGCKTNQMGSSDARNPALGVAGLEVANDLEVTLFASEPMLTNPMSMDIDARGRVWVCEGYNYRHAYNPSNPTRTTGDRIVILEDTNGDGKADKSKVFYQGNDVNAASGIALMGNKVVVSCSPNVLVFTDEDGDDKPDKKEVMFDGIGGADHDHGAHAFVFGPDGKWYFNHGNEVTGFARKGKSVTDPQGRLIDGSGKPYRQGMVYRCNPDGGLVEPLAWNFRNSHEVCLDSYGRMWQSDDDDEGNNAATRLNYVMDYGNYGLKDEVTGANWDATRTNQEATTAQRHWHLNDPGVVPNLLQTGAGSPKGIMVYEGDLLPPRFRGQIMQADAGVGAVRACLTTKSGAGFTAVTEPILNGRDEWFRPNDVCAAPDGSVFVADWYDPVVGAHTMGDSLRGRIYRVAPKGVSYAVPVFDFSTAGGCVAALQNAAISVRQIAWTKLREMGEAAEQPLAALWQSGNSRMRARAIWLLGKLPLGKGKTYMELASRAADEDLRVVSVRLARQMPRPPMAFYDKMAADISPQVRREVAFALHEEHDVQAADIWAKLAKAYAGNDRWYIEALGIGAEGQWDNYLTPFLGEIVTDWQRETRWKDIVWRARDVGNVPRLGWLIQNTTDTSEQKRYFRAFDFQPANAQKTKVLFSLLTPQSTLRTKLLVLSHAEPTEVLKNETLKKILYDAMKALPANDFINLVARYNLKDQTSKLLNLAMQDPNIEIGQRAAAIIVAQNGVSAFEMNCATGNDELTLRAIQVFGSVDERSVATQLIHLYENAAISLPIRRAAMTQMAGWNSEAALWQEVKAKRVSDDLADIAEKILRNTWHSDIRLAEYQLYGSEKQQRTGNK